MFNLKAVLMNLFLVEIFLTSFTCFARADFNLPLFVFIFMAWGISKEQKIRIAYLLIFTSFIDLIWMIRYGNLWHSDAFASESWHTSIYDFVIVISVIATVIKIVIIILMAVTESEIRDALKIEGIKENIIGFFSFNPQNQQVK